MRCDEVWREVSNYLDNEVGASLRTKMEQHFKSCKRCTAVLVGTRNVVRLVGDAAISDLLAVFSDWPDQRSDGWPARRCRSRKED
jgi:hypothetical protein